MVSFSLRFFSLISDGVGVNTFSPLGITLTSISESVSTGSPSICINPGEARFIWSFCVNSDIILLFFSMFFVNSCIVVCGISRAFRGLRIDTFIIPSSILAFGAIYASLPYCEALAQVSINAFSVSDPSSYVISYSSALKSTTLSRTFLTYPNGPRFLSSANLPLTNASKPNPQVQKKICPLATP
jgi:hypothetical protein